jgi:zinc and cadmium transporter
MTQLIFYSLLGGFFSLLGGMLLIWRADAAKKMIIPLLAFSAGAFLSASLLDLLPEAIEMGGDTHNVLKAALIGFVLFFALERLLMQYSYNTDKDHQHAEHTESLPILLIVGDSLHNFIDGLVIALAYLANPALGFVTTLAVAAHEIPQEIGDFSILLNLGWEKKKIILINIGQSLLAVLGAVVGYYVGTNLEPYLPYLLAGTAGIFLYIAASDLIPEIHHHASHKHSMSVLVPLILGIGMVMILMQFAHGA